MKLNEIQQKLKAPKNQKNTFGNYNYRSCEDILEAVKPLLGDATLTITDEIVEVGGRVYVKATATLKDGAIETKTTAFARESETKKGMDDSQITGSASSYARKYALNGLFLIDDTKDADATNKHEKEEKQEVSDVAKKDIAGIETLDELREYLRNGKDKNKGCMEEFTKLCEIRAVEIKGANNDNTQS